MTSHSATGVDLQLTDRTKAREAAEYRQHQLAQGLAGLATLLYQDPELDASTLGPEGLRELSHLVEALANEAATITDLLELCTEDEHRQRRQSKGGRA